MAVVAATATLAASTLNGTSILTAQQRADGPFKGSAVSNVGNISFTANANGGAAATLTLTVQNLLDYPIMNVAVATANTNNTISVPAASSCAGVKFRLQRSDAVLAGQTVIIAPVGGAGQLAGQLSLSASKVNVPAAQVSVTFTATSISGDYVELTSNGVLWSVNAVSTVAAGISTA